MVVVGVDNSSQPSVSWSFLCFTSLSFPPKTQRRRKDTDGDGMTVAKKAELSKTNIAAIQRPMLRLYSPLLYSAGVDWVLNPIRFQKQEMVRQKNEGNCTSRRAFKKFRATVSAAATVSVCWTHSTHLTKVNRHFI